MAELVKQALTNCPDTKIALSGYSQGGFVVSNAIAKQGVNQDDIAAAVVYGDPSRQAAGGLDKSKVKSYCVSGDGVCSGTFAITAAHLAYTRFVDLGTSLFEESSADLSINDSNGDTQDGAAFIVSKTQGGSATSSGSGSAEASGSATGESGASTSGSASGSASGETSASGSSSTDSSSSGSGSGSSSGKIPRIPCPLTPFTAPRNQTS
jgi:hypothetical protein